MICSVLTCISTIIISAQIMIDFMKLPEIGQKHIMTMTDVSLNGRESRGAR